MKEYIGITGFKFEDEINATKKAYADAGITKDSDIGTMYGFLVSEKQSCDDTREGRRSPSLKNLDSMLKDVPSWMMPTLHYCSQSRNLDVDNLSRILDYGRIADNAVAVQLNLDWPSAKNVSLLKDRHPYLYIIQQVNPYYFPFVDTENKVMEYEGLVDKLLIDPSLGAGIMYDINVTAKIINNIAEKTDKFSYVVCGGLDETSVYKKVIEAKSFVKPQFSIDAEGRLRTLDGARLNLEATTDYIMNSARAMLGK
jgi:hypothetical protein